MTAMTERHQVRRVEEQDQVPAVRDDVVHVRRPRATRAAVATTGTDPVRGEDPRAKPPPARVAVQQPPWCLRSWRLMRRAVAARDQHTTARAVTEPHRSCRMVRTARAALTSRFVRAGAKAPNSRSHATDSRSVSAVQTPRGSPPIPSANRRPSSDGVARITTESNTLTVPAAPTESYDLNVGRSDPASILCAQSTSDKLEPNSWCARPRYRATINRKNCRPRLAE